ncbi:MAG TPA: hypothetical protein VN766_05745 [Stellaceae bacterium]|jgi:hypothetical protein|nr:hypothetical protein [Stellaceae bacterium]
MPFALNFYHDQIAADGAASALAAERRLLYVRHGRVTLNGEALKAGESRFCDGALEMRSAGEWSQIWRWDLAPPNAGAALLTGSGVLSSLRMSRIVSTLAVNPGTRWVFRLDEINTPAGRVADRHQHPGPGIRCLLEGTFNVQQAAESARDLMPGDAWWETGSDTVIAWGSRQMASRFLRGMVLPTEWEGKATGTWLSGEAIAATARGNWRLYLDRIIEV